MSDHGGDRTRRPQLTLDQKLALQRNQAYHGRHRVDRQNALWVEETQNLADKAIREGLSPFEAAMFWIRLFGVLHDLRGHWRRRAAEDDSEPPQGELALGDQLRTIAACSDELLNVLSEDERIFLEYRRDYEAHPVQDAYHIRVTPKGLKTTRNFKLLDVASRELDEIEAVMDRAVERDDDAAIARKLAAKIAAPLARLLEHAWLVCPRAKVF
jgi:hypothetical protein